MERIVVGVDGSAAARAALDWAIDQARHRRTEIRAVHAWEVPALGSTAFDRLLGDPDALEAEARRELDLVIDAADVTGLDAPVQRSLRCGHPAEQILREAAAGDLVVVGNRGLGGVAPPPLGSVSRQVAAHAPCPVVVVPAPKPPQGEHHAHEPCGHHEPVPGPRPTAGHPHRDGAAGRIAPRRARPRTGGVARRSPPRRVARRGGRRRP